MARPKNKQELIEAANTNYEKLLSMIERRTEAEKSAPYDFLDDEKKKEAPQGELEVKIAAIWERVLGTKEISRDDDFFMCGGDSLKAVKIISELNATEGLPNDLAIQTLFALPTVALLAEQIEKLVSLLDVEENTEYEEGVL